MGLSVFPAPASCPTLAEITAAVAAPSLASITSAVQDNAGSAVLNWQNIAINTTVSTTSVTLTGLTGYKHLRIISWASYPNGDKLMWRLNGDAGANYYGLGSGIWPNSTSGDNQMNSVTSQEYNQVELLEINNRDLSGTQVIKRTARDMSERISMWRGNAPITSITFFTSFGQTINYNYTVIQGAN